jgi:hypothetical protein
VYDYIIDLLKSKPVEIKQKKRQRADGVTKRCTLEDKSVWKARGRGKGGVAHKNGCLDTKSIDEQCRQTTEHHLRLRKQYTRVDKAKKDEGSSRCGCPSTIEQRIPLILREPRPSSPSIHRRGPSSRGLPTSRKLPVQILVLMCVVWHIHVGLGGGTSCVLIELRIRLRVGRGRWVQVTRKRGRRDEN